MLNAFRPNRTLDGHSWAFLLAGQIVIFFGLWTLGDAFSIPGPYDVMQALGRLITEDGLLYELGVSMRVNLEAVLISTAISLTLAWSTVLQAARPGVTLATLLRFMPLTGLITVFTLAFGGGHALKVALLSFGITVFFLTTMASAIRELPKADWDQSRTLRMGDWRSVWEVVVLGQRVTAFEMLRQNAAIGWMMLTMVEGLVRSEGGIGGILLNSTKYRQFDAVFAVQGVMLLTGILQDQAIAGLKNFFCPYANLTLERK